MKIYISINEKNIITGYANNSDSTRNLLVETELDLEKIELVGNYRFENGILFEFTQEEKEADKIDNLTQIKTAEELTKENEQIWQIVEFLLKNTGFITNEEV